MSEDSLLPFELPSVARKKLSVGFDGGQLSSDAGVLVLRGVEKKLGLAARLASCIRDRRKPERIEDGCSNNAGATPELASLVGARAVMTSEVEDRSLLAESLIKQMTGGDPIPARHLYRDPFEYVPCFKLLIAGNHKPRILGDDLGIWRRIQLIPFAVTIDAASRDPKLFQKLRAELSGILNWAVDGCLQWQRFRLNPPAPIVSAVAEYREEMDVLGLWLDEACNIREDLSTTAKESFLCFSLWLKNNGFRPWNVTSFGNKVKERFKRSRNGHGVVYRGFTLKNPFYSQVDGLPV